MVEKITFKNDPYFLSDVDIYYLVREIGGKNVVDALVIYDTENRGQYTSWGVDFYVEEVTPETIRNWLVSEEAITCGCSEVLMKDEIPEAIAEFKIWAGK